MKNGSTIESYTAILRGDVNGDGCCDARDSVLIDCLRTKQLTQQDVGPWRMLAADADRDTAVSEADVVLLEQAGLLLADIDQTLREEEGM